MELGLRGSDGLRRANDLKCRRASRLRKALRFARAGEKLTAFVELA
jgi:hypothetical protein